MLTDVFAERYKLTPLWSTFTAQEHRLVIQMYRLFSEQLCPFTEHNKGLWSEAQSRLSMELGQASLSPLTYNFMGTANGQPQHFYGSWGIDHVCKTWFLKDFGETDDAADRFMKERISFVELAFRLVEERVATNNDNLPAALKKAELLGARTARGKSWLPGSYGDSLRAANEKMNRDFRDTVSELNTRFRQADCKLHYHNGFVQIADDERMQAEIDAPFWELVAAPKWKSVDTDMKEAFDRRDNNARDPAFYAVRALESAIKIISSENNWTTGKERGAHNYIDNLLSNGHLLSWEATALKHLFTHVRNPLGHGPGADEMTTLTAEQTDWVIDTCLSWVKRLARS
ncbi:AbiJ-NTD4 domain-containing protein [Bradyrhizobium liaoningense]|uniref:AbiJ-NTD4 domain-containing protein n=1 Tax=Bradyrhizobium liaoningense TaxID=43992 RepID=UPI001BAE0A32|nr:hypothetical protein [Bradyrhizobium liaoningense]MBR1167470.1 hypothetical protein [Bradyrhizobium liaoningense]